MLLPIQPMEFVPPALQDPLESNASTTAPLGSLEHNALRNATVLMATDVIQRQESVFASQDTMEKRAPTSVQRANSATNVPRTVRNVAPARLVIMSTDNACALLAWKVLFALDHAPPGSGGMGVSRCASVLRSSNSVTPKLGSVVVQPDSKEIVAISRVRTDTTVRIVSKNASARGRPPLLATESLEPVIVILDSPESSVMLYVPNPLLGSNVPRNAQRRDVVMDTNATRPSAAATWIK